MLIDLFRWFLKFVPLFALAVPLTYWAYRELRTERQWRIVLGILLAAAVPCALLFLAHGYPDSTRYIWSAGRLVPTIAWMKGYPLYTYLNQGPVFVQMYGPVSAILYTPAAFAKAPTGQMVIAAIINSIIYFGAGAIFLRSCRRGQSRVLCAAAIVLFILISSRVFVLNITATLVTIDAPAAGLAACAFAVLARSKPVRPIPTGVACGALIALAAWSKWTVAPAVGAIVIYATLLLPFRRAMTFISAMAVAGLTITGAFVFWFSPAVLLQTIVIPSRQPWQWPLLSRPRAYLRAIEWIGHDSMPVGWILLATVLIRINWRRADRQPMRAWAAENPWLIPLFAALLVLPTSALAYVKVGGIFNNSAMSVYFALLAAVSAVFSGCGQPQPSESPIPGRSRFARVMLAVLIVANCVIDSDDWREIRRKLPGLITLHDNDHERLYRFALLHPEQVYFPDYPLSTLDAEGVLYHFEAGMNDLSIAGFPISDDQLRAKLPRQLKAIIYESHSPRPRVLYRLPEFNQRVDIPELPGWVAMTRDGTLP